MDEEGEGEIVRRIKKDKRSCDGKRTNDYLGSKWKMTFQHLGPSGSLRYNGKVFIIN